jgi:hypothetical protein
VSFSALLLPGDAIDWSSTSQILKTLAMNAYFQNMSERDFVQINSGDNTCCGCLNGT